MPRVKIVANSSCTLSSELIKEYDITIISHTVTLGGKTFREVDIPPREYYQLLQESKDFPTTSQPPLQEIIDTYKKLSQETDSVIVVQVPRTFSKAYDLSLEARKYVPGLRVEVFDTGMGAGAEGIIALEAARMAKKGASLEEILTHIKKVTKYTEIIVVLDTLEYLYRGGRIGRVQALLGTALRIKPVVGIRNGLATPLAKVRTHQQALEFIVRKIKEDFNRTKASNMKCMICRSTTPEMIIEKAYQAITQNFPYEELLVLDFPSAVVSHAGLGAWGVVYYLIVR